MIRRIARVEKLGLKELEQKSKTRTFSEDIYRVFSPLFYKKFTIAWIDFS